MHLQYYIKLEGKENIIHFAQSLLDSDIEISDDFKKMYQHAIDTELHDSIMELIIKMYGCKFQYMFDVDDNQKWRIFGNLDLILENTILKTPLKQKHFSSYREFYEHIEFIKKYIFINFVISPSTIQWFKSKYPIHDENELIDCLKSYVDDRGNHCESNYYKCYNAINSALVFISYIFEIAPNVIVILGHDCNYNNDDGTINTEWHKY